MEDSKNTNMNLSQEKPENENIEDELKKRDQSPPSNPNKKKEDNNFILLYSPRTEYSSKLEEEEEMYNELKQNFDPITIKIIKKHFKERLGALKKEEMVAILKNHLLGFLPEHPGREKIMVRLLSRLFGDIDLNDNGDLEWNEFTNYIINLGGKGKKEDEKSNVAYRLKFYAISEKNIVQKDSKDQISYSFFIEKHNALGVVEDNKSVIKFYDGKTCNKLKAFIDLKEIQKSIDFVEVKKLNEKSKKNLLKQEEDKKKQTTMYKNNTDINNINKKKKKNQLDEEDFSPIINEEKEIDIDLYLNNNKRNKKDKKRKKEKERPIQNKKLSVICTCFIPEYDLLMISSTNNTITAWKYSRNEIKNVNVTSEFRFTKEELKLAIFITSSPQTSMVWDDQQKCLLTGQADGRILKWDLTEPNPILEDTLNIQTVMDKMNKEIQSKKDTQAILFNKRLLQKLHDKSVRHKNSLSPFTLEDKSKNVAVSFLLMLKKLQLLAAAYYNGFVILWDTVLKEYRKCYFDQSVAIYSIAYDSIRNLLFASGFDTDIYVYDPYIDGSCIYKLTEHRHSIKYIDTNEKESELISMDISGEIRIWDTTELTKFQTIKLKEVLEDKNLLKKAHRDDDTKKNKVSSKYKMTYLRKLKKIFIYGYKNIFFETDRSNFPDLADDQVICSCYYDKTTKNLLSFCLRKIKFWNLLTGKVTQMYDDPMGNEMTAIAVDKPCKRAYLGDNTGKLKNINLKNGTTLKELSAHSTEIKFLIHSMELNLVATCSIDNVIKIHDDHELLETEVKKELKITEFSVRALCLINRFSRLGIGLSNGVVKFYDIEHYHFDSDLESDSSSVTDEVSCLDQIEELELVLCCYSNGICKFIVTPPSTAKFNTIYQFNNSKEGIPTSICCLEFDTNLHHVFIGDISGIINCYDISQIYDTMDEIKKAEENRNFDTETIITKENLSLFNNISIKNLWCTEAHKESIRHIHYIDVNPRIIITTSHDLRIKIFGADDGKYKDEFKQSANRTKPIPVGIKYYLLDPFGEEENSGEAHYFKRKDIINFNPNQRNDNTSNQQIAEVAKKITEFNAKEKLWLSCKNSNLPYNMSNDWKLDINIDKLKEKEEEEYLKMLEKVAEIEKITNATEIILQSRSIYSEAYRPKYIEEMNDIDKIKELSDVIQDRLRNVKLAVSKANLNQSKMIDLTKKKEEENKKNQRIYKIGGYFKKKVRYPRYLLKSKSAMDILKKKTELKEKEKEKKENVIINTKDNETNLILNLNEPSGSEISVISGLKQNLGTKNNNNINKKVLPILKSRYAMSRRKLKSPNDFFNLYQDEFAQGYKDLFSPIKILFAKTKETKKQIIKTNSNLILPGFKVKKPVDPEEEEEKLKMKELERKRKINNLEKNLRFLENYYA